MLKEKQLDASILALSRDIAERSTKKEEEGLLISVIIPCHNAEKFIHPCLESLAAQTMAAKNFEIICVDDASEDSTISEIRKFKTKIQNLKIISHKENKKQGAARNTGLKASKSNYIIFVDCDDFLRMDALETLYYHAQKGHDVVASQLLKVRYDKPYSPNLAGRHLHGDIRTACLEGKTGWFPVGMLISRNLVEKNEIRFKEGIYFEDIEFSTRIFMACKDCKIIPDQLYYYVQRDTSTVNTMSKKKILDSVLAMKAIFNLLTNDSDGKKTFTKTANSWLRLQARRIRDSNNTTDQKKDLAEYFYSETVKHGIADYIGYNNAKDLKLIPLAPPQPAANIPTAEGATCTSPWKGIYEEEFSDKVIFYCEVDYHIRTVAPIARALQVRGIPTLIVDASRSTSFSTNRPLPDSELPLYSDLNIKCFNVAETLPFSTKALAFVVLNDLTYTSRLLFENFGFGVPTFGFYEGINDDWNLDRDFVRMPYRSCDYLLLPGAYQTAFFQDRNSSIVGLPNIREKLSHDILTPLKRRAVINVNFTYGVMEEKRQEFVESAVEGCKLAGLDYVISQHPADKADLSRYNVSEASVYELINENAILVSRFSTTILEALAAGRPTVYHNPIGERVPKFHEPLGAFSTSKNATELAAALTQELNFVAGGGSIRDRASLFLHAHCSPFSAKDTADRAAEAIISVLKRPRERLVFKHGEATYDENVATELSTSTEASTHKLHNRIAISELQIASRLLIDPAAMLPRVEVGGDLNAQTAQLLSEDNPEAAYLHRVLNWARREMANTSEC
ncbi:glycosyltransferase [Pseudophaeobacter sp. 1A09344]|uniref:glycosyltransferase n=1 Tax=Pseudophaeobacter sp. 1A09344 TaxID=3098144 RepID=UPI0034D5188A